MLPTKIQTVADLTGDDKLRYEANIKAMNWILLGIPSNIYNLLMRVKMRKQCGIELKVQDYDDDYQGEVQSDILEDKLSIVIMLLARAITQYFLTPTNNRLRTSSNTRNQAFVQDDRVYIQGKSSGYAGNSSINAGN
ncbi:hypothetical protein Tco_1515411 [Tanacetum coccineum]